MGEGWCNGPGGLSVARRVSDFPDATPVQKVFKPRASKEDLSSTQASRASVLSTASSTVNQLQQLQQLQQLEDDERIDRFGTFLIETHGSMIKAWRRVLDPLHDSELFFSEFVEALARASWVGDTPALWSALTRRSQAHRGELSVGLREICPELSDVIENFRMWTVDRFGGPIDMLHTLNAKPNPSLTHEEFVQACSDRSFSGDASMIFRQHLDIESSGSVSEVDVAFLEPNALKRKRALDPGVMMSLDAAKATAKKLRRRLRLQKKNRDSAVKDFRKRVRVAAGGSFIRGWRRILDLDGNMTLSKAELWKGCRKIAFHGDVAALWKAMDIDDDGAVHLQEVDARMALVLARFKKWATENHGTSVVAMQYLAALIKKRTPKWSMEEFLSALRAANFPPIPGVNLIKAATMLHEAGDITDVGYVIAQDFSFLDKWDPAPFLCASPDLEEKDRFLSALRSRYASLIVGWRRILDRDNKNRVSYKDFSDACRLMHFNDNVPGLWCALDEDASGFISLDEIDHDSADVLLAFKDWAESTFGTIVHAFKMLDTTRSNAMSFPMFRRSMRDFGYEGDAKVLFLILKPDANIPHKGKDARLTLEDIKYLSTWEPPEQFRTPDSSDEEGDEQDQAGGEEDKNTSADQPAQRNRGTIVGKRESMASRKGSTLTKATSFESTADLGNRVLIRKPCKPALVLPQKSAKYSLSAEFVFCRSPREFKHYQLSSPSRRTLRHHFSFNDLLAGSPETSLFKPRRKSPYHLALAHARSQSTPAVNSLRCVTR
mmetsp:Transcript_43351/g.81418  ORF Transcript_43351/g.81418 Transcript_43351/m.81418 type:complete len:776 (+) Transcript_43351:86-2413(+)